MNFKIMAPHQAYDKPDDFLPIAQTCFFSLALPRYTSLEVCRAKLRYAIRNADLMDADFLVKTAEGWEFT
jgi:HECT-domain (ubiquitin-transferase)